MKIDGTNSFPETQAPTLKRAAGHEEIQEVGGHVDSDDASLSTGATVSTLVAQVKQMPEVRQERVAALRQAIQNGQYHVSDRRIADAIHAQLFGVGSSTE